MILGPLPGTLLVLDFVCLRWKNAKINPNLVKIINNAPGTRPRASMGESLVPEMRPCWAKEIKLHFVALLLGMFLNMFCGKS